MKLYEHARDALNKSSIPGSLAFVAGLLACLAWLGWNLSVNLDARGISIDFGFLFDATSFPIGESIISYRAGDTYLRVLVAGLLNTLRLAVAGIVLATLFGVAIGLAARVGHPLLTFLARGYVELTRNLPLLLILMACATAMRGLPGPRQAWELPGGLLLSSRGLYMPLPMWADGHGVPLLIAILLTTAAWWGLRRLARRDRAATGILRRAVRVGYVLWGMALTGVLIWLSAVTTLVYPELRGFNFRGGWSVTPEFIAMLFGLAFYTSGFIAEIVRGSLAALPRGQLEAARALGLGRFRTLQLVLLPQALRLMLPPTTNQYLNLTKNSTLAVLIGYPDLVSVGNTALNQTGRAIETVTIYLLVYLSLSLLTSALIRRLERRAQQVRR